MSMQLKNHPESTKRDDDTGNAFELDGVDHVALPTRNIVMLERFVREVLGGKPFYYAGFDERDARAGRKLFVVMRVGPTLLEFVEEAKATLNAKTDPHISPHTAFRVTAAALDRNAERLRKLGIPVDGPFLHRASAAVSVYFQSPEGHKIELVAYEPYPSNKAKMIGENGVRVRVAKSRVTTGPIVCPDRPRGQAKPTNNSGRKKHATNSLCSRRDTARVRDRASGSGLSGEDGHHRRASRARRRDRFHRTFDKPEPCEEVWQNVIVENRVGAGTLMGANAAAKASPDGHTLLVMPLGTLFNSIISKTMPINFERDLTPVSVIADQSLVLVVNVDLPVKDVKELVSYAKTNPGALRMVQPGPAACPIFQFSCS